jgi:hypothetical protein
MSYRGQHNFVRKLAAGAVGGAAILAVNSGVALAAYGPPPPPSTPVPGGFSCVVTSQTVGAAGATIGILRLGGITAVIRIHRHTFAGHVQVTITEPYRDRGGCRGGQGIGNGGFRGYRSLGGVGILVQWHGSAVRRNFAKPLVLGITSASIRPSSRVVVWNGRRFVEAAAVIGRRSATVRGMTSSDIAVLTRVRVTPRAVTAAAAARPLAGVTGFLAAAGLTAPGAPSPGLGVLIPARLRTSGSSRASLLAVTAGAGR